MAFNWFRRQFNSSDNAPAKPPADEVAISHEAAPEATPEAETIQEEDYLAWAKAAYQNLQQRQQGDRPTEAAEPFSIETAADTRESTALEPPELATIEPLAHSDPIVAAEPTIEPGVAADAVPLPLWAQADAERQNRLERLKATALETEIVAPSVPEAQPNIEQPVPSPVVQAPVPDLSGDERAVAFDEGFLWSAEVLAAQGRRPEDISADEITWLQKLRQGLDKTRRGVVNQIKAIVGQGPLNTEAVLEIESLLLQADVGIAATDTIIAALQDKMRQETLPPDAAIAYLKTILRDILDAPIQSKYSPIFAPEKNTLNIWLMTGVNGAGKTTTIGKIAHVAQESGFNCLVAAADTFRAAAVEQIKIWAQRSNIEVIANPGQNTDPAAVVFDAITAAQSRHTELLLVDTAGRLQNKKNLMDELRKVRQVIDKKAPQAKIESLLVLDATLGQNGLRQAQVFAEAAQLSGVILTKLDGTAKGGVALAVVQQLDLPIRFIGAGEGIKDLRPFSSYEFVEALLSS
jgi:fused signal recognition particle receptor